MIADPRVTAIMTRHELLAVNGREERIRAYNPETGKYKSIPQKTRLIPKPGKKVSNEPQTDYRTGYPQSW